MIGSHLEVLQACVDDYVGLWEVIRSVTRDLVIEQGGASYYEPPNGIWTKERMNQLGAAEAAVDQKVLKDRTLNVLSDLLSAGFIKAGLPRGGGSWEWWDLSPSESIARIRREWDALEDPPTGGDIVWFVSTTEGDRALHEDKERNVL